MGMWFYVLAYGAIAYVGFKWHRMHTAIGWVAGAMAVLFVGTSVAGEFVTHYGQVGMDAVWNGVATIITNLRH